MAIYKAKPDTKTGVAKKAPTGAKITKAPKMKSLPKSGKNK